jgi:SAM-dependent methyltransferase
MRRSSRYRGLTKPSLPFHLRAVRAALRRLNSHLSRRYESSAARRHPGPVTQRSPELDEAMRHLEGLDLPPGEVREYFQKHLPRLARTLTLVPRPRTSGRILELGCYMQITPFLKQWRGYADVRGAYYGPLGRTDRRIVTVRGEQFETAVDLFDAERDRYPYDDGSFETVLACELIEHLLRDPLHLLLECRRILEDGGRLIVTTPNATSLTSVARVLHGYNSPQISSAYHRPRADAPDEAPHVREYTAFELRSACEAGGFEIESLTTEPIAEFEMHRPMWNFLEENGYNTSLRGEQTYCVAVKRSNLAVTRYPKFLYSG